jgi:ribosome-associated protein
LIEGRGRIVNRSEAAVQEGADLTRHMAQTAARAAADMFGRDVTIIDLKGLISYTDYFVVIGAETERQTRRIVDEVLEKMREEGYTPTSRRYDEASTWISLDFLDVVVHVFTDEARD